MLTEISPATGGRRRIEIYANERYSPISGWSSDGLLITDRGKYSTADGNVSFTTLEEANKAFVSIGWVWEGQWERDMSLTNVDENGFSYATDFIGFDDGSSGSGVKSMIHFVRRKRLVRFQEFDPNKISFDPSYTCDHCDLEELDRLEILLRDAIVGTTLKKHPRYLSQPKINAIKDLLIALLRFKDQNVLKVPYSTEAISQLLLDMHTGQSGWAMASAALQTGNAVEYQAQRAMEVLKVCPVIERTEISKLVIRKYDKNYEYHCDAKNCGDQCIFQRETCPNDNCGVIYSRKWNMKHDAICPEKIVDCDRLCGETVIRKNMAVHLAEICTLRPIPCPFAGLGCDTICAFRSLDDHLSDYMQSHLLLSLRRLEEQQTVIINMNRRLQYQETHLEDVEKHYVATTTGLAASIAAVELSEKKDIKSVRDDIDKVASKAQKEHYELAQELRGDLVKVKRALNINSTRTKKL